MGAILIRLTALCMLSAFSEQMTEQSALRNGIRMIAGLLAAQMALELAASLPVFFLG